jgi:anti-sigma factor RsiW
MNLLARQQRALDGMDRALRAGDPDLAAMFAIFARLNSAEPVAAEPRARRRPSRRPRPGPRWLRPGLSLSAFVLLPMAFALIILGALSGARGVKSCGVGPLVNRAACGVHQPATTGKQTTSAGSDRGGASCSARARTEAAAFGWTGMC